MTENEAVERMARALWLAYDNGECWEMYSECAKDDWRKVARLALTSHPAVEALRRAHDAMDSVRVDWENTTQRDFSEFDNARAHASTVLASLPKEK